MEIMESSEPDAQKTRYHHGDLRAALIEEARRLVEAKGPDHFSMAEVARAAGVSTAAPYRHFRDKDDLLDAICADGMARHYVAMEQAVAGLPPRDLERIRRLGAIYVGFAQDEPGVFRLMFGQSHESPAMMAFAAEKADTFGLVTGEVAAILGLPEQHPEAARRAFMLWTFVHGLSFLLIDDKVQHAGVSVDVSAFLEDIGKRVLRDGVAI